MEKASIDIRVLGNQVYLKPKSKITLRTPFPHLWVPMRVLGVCKQYRYTLVVVFPSEVEKSRLSEGIENIRQDLCRKYSCRSDVEELTCCLACWGWSRPVKQG